MARELNVSTTSTQKCCDNNNLKMGCCQSNPVGHGNEELVAYEMYKGNGMQQQNAKLEKQASNGN